MTIKHYFNPMSRAVTTDWMLKELDAPHEQILIDTSNEQQNTEYRAINPMGKIPALQDGDCVVTEVAAICTHLADRFPEKNLAPELGTSERAEYYRYLFIAGNTIEPALALNAVGFVHPQPSSAGWGDIERVVATIEAMTPDEDWALGKQFTTADVVFGGLLDFGSIFGWLQASPKVIAYVQRLRERPAYIESHQAFIEMLKK